MSACVLFQAVTFFRRRTFQEVNGFNERNQTAWDMRVESLVGVTLSSTQSPALT
jgi:hypothetical protein